MKQKLIHTVVTDMLSYLNNAQVEKLKEVLLHTLWDYDISPSSVSYTHLDVYKRQIFLPSLTLNKGRRLWGRFRKKRYVAKKGFSAQISKLSGETFHF